MKRLLAFFLSIWMLYSLAGCVYVVEEGYKDQKEEITQQSPKQTTPNTIPEETEFPVPPELKPLITGFFAEETMQADVMYIADETQYGVRLGFTAEESLDFQFGQLVWETQTYEVSEVLFEGSLESGQTLIAQVGFPGDMTTYGMTVTDQNGSTQKFAVYISGMDGSLICEIYE